MLAKDETWQPVALTIRAPSAGEISPNFAAVQEWADEWKAVSARHLRLEYRDVGGRLVGANRLPALVWVDAPQQLWGALGVSAQVQRFSELVEHTRQLAPRLVAQMAAQPMKVLALEQIWPALVQTVLWIEAYATPDMYLRQIDVPGVDTKFIEANRRTLADLLDRQLAAERVDHSYAPAEFAARYRLRRKPAYVRLRRLDPGVELAGSFCEITVRVDELAEAPLKVSTVYVVENEITYLAFPPTPDAVVVLGGGYGLSALRPLHWLNDVRLFYWGDIDTHGFAILHQIRHAFPHARSMLMDRKTLLTHDTQWVREGTPTKARLDLLQPSEAALYRDLVEDALGPSVRLEQERIRYSEIVSALAQ